MVQEAGRVKGSQGAAEGNHPDETDLCQQHEERADGAADIAQSHAGTHGKGINSRGNAHQHQRNKTEGRGVV